jgi:hypothetical protein
MASTLGGSHTGLKKGLTKFETQHKQQNTSTTPKTNINITRHVAKE